ncbi:MAG: stilbene synthase, partial [Verrucomicrobiaceae bacterium]
MFLRSLATAVPPNSFTQETCWDAMRDGALLEKLKPRSASLVEKILTNGTSGIRTRNLALGSIDEIFGDCAQSLNQRFEKEAAPLAENSLTAALEKAGLRADQLDALFVCTCTGYLCPGVSSHLAEQAGLRADVYLADLVGLGCGA